MWLQDWNLLWKMRFSFRVLGDSRTVGWCFYYHFWVMRSRLSFAISFISRNKFWRTFPSSQMVNYIYKLRFFVFILFWHWFSFCIFLSIMTLENDLEQFYQHCYERSWNPHDLMELFSWLKFCCRNWLLCAIN